MTLDVAQDGASGESRAARGAAGSSKGPPSLARRLFVTNAVLLVAAFLALALTPLTIKSPLEFGSGGLLSVGGLSIVLGLNLWITRRSLGPLRRLSASMRQVDLLRPGRRVPVYGDSAEVVGLTASFNEMLARLESERRESVRRTLSAQERERLDLARELHDEVGQSLTALMLQLDYAAKMAPPEIAGEVAEARESARATLEEIRRIARRLRPEALDDLGLVSAIAHLIDRVGGRTHSNIERRLSRDLPPLSPESELVIYRVAQESLTNVIRHAEAERIEVSLSAHRGGVVLRIADDGRGLGSAPEGSGIKGMRERAVLVGGRLEIAPGPRGGTVVRLEVGADAGNSPAAH